MVITMNGNNEDQRIRVTVESNGTVFEVVESIFDYLNEISMAKQIEKRIKELPFDEDDKLIFDDTVRKILLSEVRRSYFECFD